MCELNASGSCSNHPTASSSPQTGLTVHRKPKTRTTPMRSGSTLDTMPSTASLEPAFLVLLRCPLPDKPPPAPHNVGAVSSQREESRRASIHGPFLCRRRNRKEAF
jgi:hypothetical protein